MPAFRQTVRVDTRRALAAALAVLAATPLPAPAAADERVEVRLLEASFAALDRQGRPVTDLRPEEVIFRLGGERIPAEFVEGAARWPAVPPPAGARMTLSAPPAAVSASPGAGGALAVVIDVGRWPRLRRSAFAEALSRAAARAAAEGTRVAVFSAAGATAGEARFTTDPTQVRRGIESAIAASSPAQTTPTRQTEDLVARLEGCITSADYLRGRVETDAVCVRAAASTWAEQTASDRERWIESLSSAARATAAVFGPVTLIVAGHPPILDTGEQVREALVALAGEGADAVLLTGSEASEFRSERGLDRLIRLVERLRLRLVFIDPSAAPAGGARGRRLLAPGRDPRRQAFEAAIAGLRRLAEPLGGKVLSGRSPEELTAEFENWRAALHRAGARTPRDLTRREIDRLRVSCTRRGVRLRAVRALRPRPAREPAPGSARLALARSVALEDGSPGRAVEFAVLADPSLLRLGPRGEPSCHLQLSTAAGAGIADAFLPRVGREASRRPGQPPRWVAGRLELPPGRYRLQARLAAGGEAIDLQRLIEVPAPPAPSAPGR